MVLVVLIFVTTDEQLGPNTACADKHLDEIWPLTISQDNQVAQNVEFALPLELPPLA